MVTKKKPAVVANKPDINSVIKSFEALRKDAEAWDKQSYASANTKLYDLLDKCLQMYLLMRKDTGLARKFNQHLADLNILQRSDTSLPTKIVRYVFGAAAKQRTYAYARVLQIAATEKPENVSLSSFIADKGGIEELRRTPANGGPTVKEQRAANISFAEKHVEKAEAIAEIQNLKQPIVPGEGASCAVALVYCAIGETPKLIYQSPSIAMLNTMLALFGADMKTKHAAQGVVQAANDIARARNNTIAQASNKPVSDEPLQKMFPQKTEENAPPQNGSVVEFG